ARPFFEKSYIRLCRSKIPQCGGANGNIGVGAEQVIICIDNHLISMSFSRNILLKSASCKTDCFAEAVIRALLMVIRVSSCGKA
ncbi:MAG: hypothetical protein JXR40_12160, partial [Pontiellaceae bacterium]|nr:hypothetical protein [Pontiellaceae bacterium]